MRHPVGAVLRAAVEAHTTSSGANTDCMESLPLSSRGGESSIALLPALL